MREKRVKITFLIRKHPFYYGENIEGYNENKCLEKIVENIVLRVEITYFYILLPFLH